MASNSRSRRITNFRAAALAALILATPIPTAAASQCDAHRIEDRPASDAGIPTFESFLLRVERRGIPDSYVFGTFHSADPRVIANWAWLRVLLSAWQPRLVVVERDLLKEAPTGSAGFEQTAASAIKGIVKTDPELHRLAVQALTELGFSRPRVDGLSILQAVALLEQTAPHSGPENRQPILDAFLQSASHELNLPVLAIETHEALTERAVTDMTVAQQRELLWIAVCNRERNARSLERQTAAFAANDVAALYRAMGPLSTEGDSAQGAFIESLLNRRNQTFWARLESEFEKGDLMLAVGNLHLFVPDGLLDQLFNSGKDGTPYRVYEVTSESFRFGLKTGHLGDLMNWVQVWIREHEGIEIERADFDPLGVEFRSETALQAAFCPGQRCRVEATYEPARRSILLTETVFSRLVAAGYPLAEELDVGHGREEYAAARASSRSPAYAQSIVIRELVRHGYAVDATHPKSSRDRPDAHDGGTQTCRLNYQLHRASVAQAQFLRERLSPERPYIFPLDPACSRK